MLSTSSTPGLTAGTADKDQMRRRGAQRTQRRHQRGGGLGVGGRIGRPAEGDGAHHRPGTPEQAGISGRIQHIALDHRQLRIRRQGRGRGITHHHRHRGAAGQRLRDDSLADVAGAAEDHDIQRRRRQCRNAQQKHCQGECSVAEE
jgi:hypothetical protein